jgi:hypothetical protein
MLSARLVILLVGLLTSSCSDLGIQIRSELLDATTFSAMPAGDVDGDGIGDIVLNAEDRHVPAAAPQPGAWLLSGKDLAPIYAIAPQSNGERLTWAAGAQFAGAGLKVEANDVIVSLIDTSRPDATPIRAVFAIDPSRSVRIPEQKAASDSSSEDADDAHDDRPGADPEPQTPKPRLFWQRTWLIDPSERGWSAWGVRSDPTKNSQSESTDLDPQIAVPLRTRISGAHPDLRCIQPCGDFDADGVLDMSGLADDPRSVVIVSGADLRILRRISLESRPLATVATGGFQLGDVDGDGVPDWLIGIHVTQSEDHDTPRTCRLGLIALVSGADFHVIKSLERESFLAGPSRQCPVVTLPEPIQSQSVPPDASTTGNGSS